MPAIPDMPDLSKPGPRMSPDACACPRNIHQRSSETAQQPTVGPRDHTEILPCPTQPGVSFPIAPTTINNDSMYQLTTFFNSMLGSGALVERVDKLVP